MVSLTQAIVLGIVQGITEWLPISSSGHLVMVQEFLGWRAPIFFDIMLHVATLAVVLVYFREEVMSILSSLARFDFSSEGGRLALLILLGSIPTGLIGVVFRDTFELFFHNLRYVGFALFGTGVLLFFSERFESDKDLSPSHALLIGLAQGVAIIPGVSRSGATISTALLLGVEKKKAASFSFLLSVPAIIGASLLEAGEVVPGEVHVMGLVVGMLASAVVGYLSLSVLLRLVVSQRFHYFAYYCLMLGLVLIFLG